MEKVSTKGAELSTLPAPTGAEGRAAKKLMELEAGRVLVAQAAKQAEEARERLEEERLEARERDTEREQRDTPELSRQSKWFGVEGKLLMEANLRWILEMEQELWEELLNWYPAPQESLSKQLEELSRLYLALLEAVLTHTTGQEQVVQKGRLDAALSEKLNLVLEVRLRNLMALLEQTGQQETIERIRYSLYKRATGENISPKAAEQFFSQGKATRAVSGSVQASGAPQTNFAGGGRSFSTEGSVYQSCGGRNVRVSQAFDAQRSLGELELGRRSQALSETKGRSLDGRLFSGDELTRADAFAKHLSETNRLWEGMGIPRRNQEAAGYLAGLTAIKGQIYSSDTGRSGAMAEPVRDLVNQMVDYYLNQKGAYEVYYYTTGVYEKTKDPQRAASEGLAYAYRQFLEKKGESSGEKQEAYSQEAGFFQMLEGRAPEEEFRRGARLLEENWRDFLAALALDKEGKGIVLRMQRYSPWGALAEAEERRRERDQKAEQIFLKQALVVAVIALLYFLWRFFLR
ncbi:MAG: hypothetical protein HFI29_10270 [Lachnospiraceae bacterium]|jgi:hypothetical protein|nr:hypothetical protein [Lachnospiraceae bacterium]